jgi:hypothetical protein
MSPLLLGECVCCGEPIFRHRTITNRQISCEQLRQIDQALQSNNAPAKQAIGAPHVIRGDFDRARQEGVR